MPDQPVYTLICKLEGVYTSKDAAEQARALILQHPEKYLTIATWPVREFEFPFVKFMDEKLEQERLTSD